MCCVISIRNSVDLLTNYPLYRCCIKPNLCLFFQVSLCHSHSDSRTAMPSLVNSNPSESKGPLVVCPVFFIFLPEYSAPLVTCPSVYTASVSHGMLTTSQQTCGSDKRLIEEAVYIMIRLSSSQQDSADYLQQDCRPVLDKFLSNMSHSSCDIKS